MKGLEYGGSICISYLYMMLVKMKMGKKMVTYFQNLQKYLTHIQNSVFEGEISTIQLEKLRGELKPHVNTNLDSVILFKSRSEKWLDKEFWGKEDDLTSFII